VLVQDRGMVCAERTMGWEIVLDAHVETARCVGHEESNFGPFGDSVIVGPFGDSGILMQDRCTLCTKCTIGS
jgi:hypothetical protein